MHSFWRSEAEDIVKSWTESWQNGVTHAKCRRTSGFVRMCEMVLKKCISIIRQIITYLLTRPTSHAHPKIAASTIAAASVSRPWRIEFTKLGLLSRSLYWFIFWAHMFSLFKNVMALTDYPRGSRFLKDWCHSLPCLGLTPTFVAQPHCL